MPAVVERWGEVAGVRTHWREALGGDVHLEMIERAGHWTWLDRPDVIDKAAEFLAASRDR